MSAPEPPPLRRHQREAREALARLWDAGGDRAWVVLPPGAGKTLVGLLEARDHLRTHAHGHVVVLGPNTAIVNQWLGSAGELGLEAGRERDLSAPFTATTYQSLAVFDPDAEVDEDGEEGAESGRERGQLIDRLHPNGRALIDALASTEELLVVLDECHHLLEVWGRLLADVLALLPHARVLGLTATPPEALSQDQAALVRELFGEVAYATTIPAVVREGDLAPFAELAYLVEPTPIEDEWLGQESLRFRELTTRLLDPAYGSISFQAWLHARFVAPVPQVRTWASMLREEPDLAAAALRMHHDGMLELPTGARPAEEHRRPPEAEDWVLLISDWVTQHLVASEDPVDAAIVEDVRRALPAVGYQLTKRGIRRGRTPTDRVLARSEAKTHAAADIIAAEGVALGDRLRQLVLCDHERASATLPVSLDGVLAPQAGSAVAVLDTLLRDPRTDWLAPVLVTGRTIAGSPLTMEALRTDVARTAPDLAAELSIEALPGATGAVQLVGPRWRARHWVGPVTRFFEDGGSRILIGTRALLGEGWNARRITGLVDLTSATSTTAVVQTRGRALRIDPAWPDKVAITWSVVCVSAAHPRGDQDWKRLVRKHHGFFGVDEEGVIADGVAHLDATFSPYFPPAVSAIPDINARMTARAADRDAIRAAWR
ncbi:DEAD/DEAH box helicase family protein, partial [Nocardioides massiliensis]